MTIKKMDYEWADDGSKTQPSDAKIAEGWVGGDRPSVEYFNWLDSRQDDKLNRIIRERVDSFYTDATDPDKMITTGLWTDDWGCTSSAKNYISGGATKEYTDVKAYFNSDGDPRLLLLDMAARKIEIWNPRSTGSVIRLSQDLATDMVGGDTYAPISMCTDGTYVFVVFENFDDNTIEVNCWTINEASSTWVNPWTSEATLNGTGAYAATPTLRSADCCIANDSYIAVITKHNAIASSATSTVSILAKSDGTIDSNGSGNATLGGTFIGVTRSIASDGTDIYFLITDTTDVKLCSCTIADATAAGSMGSLPLATTGRTTGVVCANGNSLVTAYNKSTAYALGDEQIKSHRLTGTKEGSCDIIVCGQDNQGTPNISGTYAFESVTSMCFDGINFWAIGEWENNPGSGYMLTKMDSAKFTNGAPNTYREIDKMGFSVFLLAQDVDFNVASDGFTRLAFDGRDIWANVEVRASQTASGRIYRLPLALLRS